MELTELFFYIVIFVPTTLDAKWTTNKFHSHTFSNIRSTEQYDDHNIFIARFYDDAIGFSFP